MREFVWEFLAILCGIAAAFALFVLAMIATALLGAAVHGGL